MLENFGKQAYFSSRNLKKPDEDKFYTYEDFNYDSSVVLYETEYN
ncbi:rep domain protein [Streptococcus pneumoniae 2071247]|nr:rep domain protein [Streptococcus pneumoniae 2071247]